MLSLGRSSGTQWGLVVGAEQKRGRRRCGMMVQGGGRGDAAVPWQWWAPAMRQRPSGERRRCGAARWPPAMQISPSPVRTSTKKTQLGWSLMSIYIE